jgi:hypothetical protein
MISIQTANALPIRSGVTGPLANYYRSYNFIRKSIYKRKYFLNNKKCNLLTTSFKRECIDTFVVNLCILFTSLFQYRYFYLLTSSGILTQYCVFIFNACDARFILLISWPYNMFFQKIWKCSYLLTYTYNYLHRHSNKPLTLYHVCHLSPCKLNTW